ncbi:hypothetical protein BDY19DRAFT_1044071 [Irpex rosettiformis]|uniref:Uncharacterized protein n=1 Tax=Irpex rosettiformis TaxID=378272 RepID=A0ACB8UIG7_9APHY|nr:hypothetical protein BDY19DRAFT_1044071 [Irpex rosettiformis]
MVVIVNEYQTNDGAARRNMCISMYKFVGRGTFDRICGRATRLLFVMTSSLNLSLCRPFELPFAVDIMYRLSVGTLINSMDITYVLSLCCCLKLSTPPR